MTDATAARLGLAQGGSDNRELFLKLFSGEVIAASRSVLQYANKHRTKALNGGKSYAFPFTGTVGTKYHTAGAEILGQTQARKEVLVSPDDVIYSDLFVDNLDEIMNAYDVRASMASQLGYSVAEAWDKNILRTLILSARGSEVLTGEGGGTVLTRANASSDAATLYNAFVDARRSLTEKKAVQAGAKVYGTLNPLEFGLLMSYDKVINADYNKGAYNTTENYMTIKVAGVDVSENTHAVFGETYNANSSTIQSVYNGNFANTVATVWTDDAACSAIAMSQFTKVVDQPERLGTLLYSAMSVGTRVLNPKCAVEIKKS